MFCAHCQCDFLHPSASRAVLIITSASSVAALGVENGVS